MNWQSVYTDTRIKGDYFNMNIYIMILNTLSAISVEVGLTHESVSNLIAIGDRDSLIYWWIWLVISTVQPDKICIVTILGYFCKLLYQSQV